MKFIYFTKTLQHLSVPQLADFARSTGLDGIDMAVRPGYPVDPINVEKLLPEAVKLLRDHGLTLPLVSIPVGMNDPKSTEAVRIFNTCAAAGVGMVKIGYFPFQANFAADFASARRGLEGFCKLAELTKVRALHHTHSGNMIGSNFESSKLLLEPFDPHLLGCFVDTGHQAVNGGPFRMALNYVARWLSAVAIKDMVVAKARDGAKRTVVPAGQGFVNWGEVEKGLLTDRQFDGVVSLHGEYETADLADRIAKAKLERVFLGKLFGN